MSSYPGSLDNFATNRTDSTSRGATHKDDHNKANDALNRIEAELGVNPSGSYTDVAARVAALEALALTWIPAPPSSYDNLNTHTVASTLLDTATGSTAGYATYYTDFQHVVQTENGNCFATYQTYDQNSQEETHIVLKRSSASPFTSWSTIYDTNTSGDQKIGWSALECDRDSNVYLILDQYPTVTGTASTKIYKFSPPSYGTPTLITNTSIASGKWAANFDQSRQWIWVVYWGWYGSSNPNLLAYDLSGTQVFSKQMWKPETGNGTTTPFGPQWYAKPQHQSINIDRNGVIYLVFTPDATARFPPNAVPQSNRYSYYAPYLIYSTDAGATWKGKADTTLTMPIYGDDTTNANADTGFLLANPGVDWISGSDANYGIVSPDQYNNNLLYNSTVNKGNVFGGYVDNQGVSNIIGTPHYPMFRFNMTSKTVDYRITPSIKSDNGDYAAGGLQMGATFATFVQDTSMASRLYFVGEGSGAQGNRGKIAVLRCDNSDATTPNWFYYALGSIGTGANLDSITACRWVQSDGSIIGICSDANNKVWFFRVT